jgi:hypothetical protein
MERTGRLIARIALDAAAGLVLFVIIALAAGTGRAENADRPATAISASIASSGERGPDGAKLAGISWSAAQPSSATAALGPDRNTAYYLLAAVFSALAAFNLGFFRHLRRIRAVPSAREDRWQV